MARRNLRLVWSRSEDPALQSPECEEAPNGPPWATGCQWLRHLPAVRTRKSCETQKGTIWWRCGFWRQAVEALQKRKMNLSVLIAWFPHCSPGFGHLLLSLFSTSCLKVGYQKHMFHHKFSQINASDVLFRQNIETKWFNMVIQHLFLFVFASFCPEIWELRGASAGRATPWFRFASQVACGRWERSPRRRCWS